MNGDTDQAEAEAQVAAFLDPVELVQYENVVRRRLRHREELAAQARSMISRIQTDIIWRLERGPHETIWSNPFTNGGHTFDEAVHRVRADDEVHEAFLVLAANRRGRAERAAVEWLAGLFKGGKLYLPGRKHPYRPLR